MTTTAARRITRTLNRHARSVGIKSATGGGIIVYCDAEGHEVYYHNQGVVPTTLHSPCPFPYSTQWRVRPRRITTQAEVTDALPQGGTA